MREEASQGALGHPDMFVDGVGSRAGLLAGKIARVIEQRGIAESLLGYGLIRWAPDGNSLLYIRDEGGISNAWRQPIAGGRPERVTNFTSDQIFRFDVSRDG